MGNKKAYTEFCKKTYIPIFSQSWWMDIVCGKENWNVITVESKGNIIAAMPYYLKEQEGKRIITKPKLTQNNGVIIDYPPKQSYIKKLDYEEKILNKIIEEIEELDIDKYEQQYHYSFDNWLPFFWNGYKEMTRYTYVIEDTSDEEQILKNFSSSARNKLRKAKNQVNIIESEDIDKFYSVNELTYARQDRETPFEKELVRKLYNGCRERNCGKIFFAVDEDEQVHSVAFIVWDDRSVYYLVNGTDPKYKASQANTLLIYHSIIYASQLNKSFDFEGSVIQPIEQAFRQFGGIRKPYFRIFKEFNEDV
ncbi:MAG: GNAT family N-acetyltransferase [Anaerovoracaceae bacterium]